MDDVSTAFSIPNLLYEEQSLGVFILVTIILGGGAAWLTGRAIAGTWRPAWQVAVYMMMLACAVRFIHMALFEGTLLSPHYYVVDTLVCMGFGFAGFRVTRVQQMIRQYSWLNVRTGTMRWRRQTP
jgi:hypothetical protein